MPFAVIWMQLEIIILSEVSQKEKDKYHMTSIICRIQNMAQRNQSTKQKQTHRHRKQTYGCQGGLRKDWELGISKCKLLYTGWINNKVLLYTMENYIQYPVIKHNGKE